MALNIKDIIEKENLLFGYSAFYKIICISYLQNAD